MQKSVSVELRSLPDLRACESEPIHIPGSVEPNGALLVVQEPELRIVQASANCKQLLGVEATALLGQPMKNLFDTETMEALRLRILPANLEGRRRYLTPARLQSTATRFDGLVHRNAGALIFELEPADPDCVDGGSPDFHVSLTDAIADLSGTLTLDALSERMAGHIRKLTGFDRVMVYRFLEDDSGAVIAEDRRSDLTPYLGLHYPASDIPVQARRLYVLNSLRFKADVDAAAAALVPPLHPVTGQPLDMSYCVLRAMSPVHVEYLRNMGVGSTMSVSLIKDGRLWGLIACHHMKARVVPHRIRISCETLALVFSAHAAAAEGEDARRAAVRTRRFAIYLTDRLRAERSVRATMLEEGERLVSAIDADGMAMSLDGELSLLGNTPNREQVVELVNWLDIRQTEYIFSTDKLAADYEEGKEFAEQASGILSARLAMGRPDFVLWFRQPTAKVTEWGGNPNKPVQETEEGKRISPRLSFERWKETVMDRSKPWQEHALEFGLALRQAMAEVLLVEKNEEVTRLNFELKRSNVELEQFAYAASHDLQEPVRTVRAYAQLLGLRAGSVLDHETLKLVNVIESGAARMGALISALLTYGQVGGMKRELRPVPLEEVCREAALNLTESIRDSGAAITHDELPTIPADASQMIQLVQNLIGNSIKYRKPGVPPHVHLSAERKDHVWEFAIQDNGRGFSEEMAEKIFAPFQRLHGHELPGTGIGLAICRRIVENHGGSIRAESAGDGMGARFCFTLPEGRGA